MEIAEQYRVLSIKELGEHLGFTAPTVYTYLSRERWNRIPPPSIRLGSGPVWYVGDVQEWQEKVQKERVFLKWREIYQKEEDV
jgi:predicted DNA-binding transcriptional regulator AlpA